MTLGDLPVEVRHNGRYGAHSSAAALVLLIVAGILGAPAAGNAKTASPGGEGRLDNLVFVTEDIAKPGPGCDAISAFELGSEAGLFHGPTHASVARLAGTSDLRRIVANAHGDNFLYVLTRETQGGETRWNVDPNVQGGSFSWVGGLVIMPDDETLLVGSEGQSVNLGPPYRVSKYLLSEFTPGRVGQERGRIVVDSAVLEILAGTDASIAHIVTDAAVLETVDTNTMTRVAPPIQMEPFSESGFVNGARVTPLVGYRFVAHAAISPDGRYVITNRIDVPELNVADVVQRTAWTVATTGSPNGGVAYNRGWVNQGLVAVHMGNRVVVYHFVPPYELTVRGSIAVQPPEYSGGFSGANGPAPSVAWSASGSHLIAGTSTSPDGDADFIVISVEDQGLTLRPEMLWTACETSVGGKLNTPNDILTANGLIGPTATSTPTSSPTAAPTASPLYLPLLLRERCTPETSHADTLLVLDASTSMLEDVRPGYTKREAAADAAGRFIDLLRSGDQAGVVSFNDTAVLDQGLTDDKVALHAALPRVVNRRFTRLDLGIEKAREALEGVRRDPNNRAVIILLTDGKANPEPVETAMEEARLAKERGVTLFVIGLGRPEDLDDGALRTIASRPDYYYQTTDATTLTAIYEEIAGVIPCPPEQFWGRR